MTPSGESRTEPSESHRSLRKRVGANVVFLGLVSLMNDISSEMIYPLLPLFLTSTLGISMTFLGAIEGAADSATSFVKLGSGWLSDRLRRRKPLVLSGYGISALSRPAIAAATAGWHVLGLRLADRVGKGIRTSPRDALIAESVRKGDLGLAFGFHRAMDHLGAVIGPLLATAFLAAASDNLRALFLVAAIPGLASAAVVLFCVRESSFRGLDPKEPRSKSSGGPRPLAGTAGRGQPDERRRLRLRSPFGVYLVSVALFSLGNSTDAFVLLRARDLGLSAALLPALWMLLNGVKALCSTPAGYAADRFGRKRVLLIGWAVYFATYLGFAFAESAAAAVALFAVYGVYFALAEGTEKALVAQLAGGARGTAYGMYHLAVGISAFPASVVFGAVWERWGPQVAFSMGAALAAAAAAILLAVRTQPPAET